MSDLRERLADYAHEAWAGWMRHMLDTRGIRLADAGVALPPEDVARWRRQIQTPYADLTEAEKESDRAEADRMLAICAQLEADLAAARAEVERVGDLLALEIVKTGRALTERDRALDDLAVLRQRHAEILALLNPVNPHETIEGAIRNLQQALLSEQGNVATLEKRHAEAVEEAFRSGYRCCEQDREMPAIVSGSEDEAWATSEAKAGLT